jgi:Gpi18-like mannosyltransferase
MKTLYIVKGTVLLIVFCVGFYLLINYVFSEVEKREKFFRVEFNSGAIYWADSVHVISQNQISFFDVRRKRNVKIYGQFTISAPKNKD